MVLKNMNVEPMSFNFKGNNVRSKVIDGKVYFVAKDVAKAIGYKDTTSAIKKHIKNKYKAGCQIATHFGIKEMTMISEPGIYEIATKSNLPQAEPFQDWVFEEVLPSINHTGKYERKQSQPINSNNIIEQLHDPKNLMVLLEDYSKKQEQLEAQKTDVAYSNALKVSKNSVPIGTVAKILKQKGVKIGRNTLFKWLRNNGYLCKKGNQYNLPRQQYMKSKLFEVKTWPVSTNHGFENKNVTMVTAKGQRHIISKFLPGCEDISDNLPGKLD